MRDITPFLWFDTESFQAAEFYFSLFSDSEVTSVRHYGEGARRPAGLSFIVTFMLNRRGYTALIGGPEHVLSEAFSLQVDSADQAEADRPWEGLTTDGGQESRRGVCRPLRSAMQAAADQA